MIELEVWRLPQEPRPAPAGWPAWMRDALLREFAGYRCHFHDLPRWLQQAALRERDSAAADPGFVAQAVDYCDARTRTPFRLTLTRWG